MSRPRTCTALLALSIAAASPGPTLAAQEPDLDPGLEPSSAPQDAAEASGPTPASEPTALPTAAAPFEGSTWRLAAYRSGDGLVQAAAGTERAFFHFEGGHLAASAGCNRIMGAYTTNGGDVRFLPALASSMMACPEPLAAQERAVQAALAAAVSYRLEQRLLEFADAQGHPVLRLSAEEPSPLIGRPWELSGYSNGKQAIVSALAGTEITLELRDDGTIGGSDGCNRYMSGYTLEGAKLVIGPLATGRMACRGPKGAAEQAEAFAEAVGTVAGWRIEGDRLTLLNGEGKPAAQFRIQPPPRGEPPLRARTSAPAADGGTDASAGRR
jgi:heat shock protein HslJ